MDMSSPEGGSVNDGIPEELCSLSYVGIKDAVRAIQDRGRGAMMAKVDVKSAYRNIPVHPEDRWMMGMMWEGALYIDTCLPFGLRSAPKIFTAIAVDRLKVMQKERPGIIDWKIGPCQSGGTTREDLHEKDV